MKNRPLLVIAVAGIASASPALARPGGWGGPGWGGPGPYDRGSDIRSGPDRSREGKVTVDRFVGEGDAAAALGHGTITVDAPSDNGDYVGVADRAAYEAAVVDRLVHAGYDTTQPKPTDGQIAELTIQRTELSPAEPKRKPVSGEFAISVSNRGTSYGLALNLDLSKPLPPLVSTRLEARIRDRATGKVLWEGRAEVATRAGDEKWNEQAIADRLAEALFDGFPHAAKG